MAEKWADIPGFAGVYQISSEGRVRSASRVIKRRRAGKADVIAQYASRLLTPHACSNGYLSIQLGCNSKNHLVHRLVAAAFIPGDQTLQVNHKNGIRHDNRVENLEWLSCSDNHRHSYKELTRKQHKLTRAVKVSKAGTEIRFSSASDAAKFLGVVPGSIASAALRGHPCRGCEITYV